MSGNVMITIFQVQVKDQRSDEWINSNDGTNGGTFSRKDAYCRAVRLICNGYPTRIRVDAPDRDPYHINEIKLNNGN